MSSRWVFPQLILMLTTPSSTNIPHLLYSDLCWALCDHYTGSCIHTWYSCLPQNFKTILAKPQECWVPNTHLQHMFKNDRDKQLSAPGGIIVFHKLHNNSCVSLIYFLFRKFIFIKCDTQTTLCICLKQVSFERLYILIVFKI